MHFSAVVMLLTLTCVADLPVIRGVDRGFELQYTTNTQEHLNYPIRFQTPLPPWLQGRYMRNGPGQYGMGSRHLEHAFDGFAKPHGVRFPEGGGRTAYYTTQFIRSEYYLRSVEANDVSPSMLMLQPTPPFGYFTALRGFINGFDNMDVNLYDYNGTLVAMSDFWPVYELNRTNLGTMRRVFAPIPGESFTIEALPYPSSAHPMPEAGTSNYISYVSIPPFFGRSRFLVVRIVSPDVREAITEFYMDRLYYVHSFAATKNYAVFFLGPVYTDIWAAVKSWQSLDSIKWAKDEPTQVRVVNLSTGEVTELTTDAWFLSHHANAWEVDDNTIVADGVFYPSNQIFSFRVLKSLYDRNARNKLEADGCRLLRHTIHLGRNARVSLEVLPTTPEHEFMKHMEYPIINEAFRYRQNRYLYGTVMKSDFSILGNQTIIKRDLQDPSQSRVWMQENHFPHETWFVGRPGGTAEDDGILLCDILDGNRGLSYTAVFNATTLELVNKAYHPTWNSWTFHGRLFH